MHSSGKEALLAFAEGDEHKMMLMGLKRFTKTEPFNTTAARQEVAVKLIEEGKSAYSRKTRSEPGFKCPHALAAATMSVIHHQQQPQRQPVQASFRRPLFNQIVKIPLNDLHPKAT